MYVNLVCISFRNVQNYRTSFSFHLIVHESERQLKTIFFRSCSLPLDHQNMSDLYAKTDLLMYSNFCSLLYQTVHIEEGRILASRSTFPLNFFSGFYPTYANLNHSCRANTKTVKLADDTLEVNSTKIPYK